MELQVKIWSSDLLRGGLIPLWHCLKHTAFSWRYSSPEPIGGATMVGWYHFYATGTSLVGCLAALAYRSYFMSL